MTIEFWLQVGTGGMFIGLLLLFFPMQRNKLVAEEGDYIAHFLVPVIAMTLYLLMALGYGSVLLPSGRIFLFARYIDWVFTTPLLLLSLISGTVRGSDRKHGALIAGLMAADIYMIMTGLVAGWTDDPTLKWSFYTLSCLAFLAIYSMLWGPFKRLSESSPTGANYRKKAVVLSVLWFAYPVVFLIGQEGLRLWSATLDAGLFTILDITTKVIYGLWAVSLARKSNIDQQLPVKDTRSL